MVQSLDFWETEYQQILEGVNPVPEYVKGSWLKPFLDALDEPEKSAFEAQYKKNVLVEIGAFALIIAIVCACPLCILPAKDTIEELYFKQQEGGMTSK